MISAVSVNLPGLSEVFRIESFLSFNLTDVFEGVVVCFQ